MLALGDDDGKVMAMKQRTFYEFFAGGGMARAGLGSDWRCLFANDFDPKKVAAYRANWGDDELFVGDVAGIAPFELPDEADLAWASFPCQDVSLAGAGAGLGGERSGAFWSFWRLVLGLKRAGRAPKLIALENVCGLLTSHGGDDFVALSRALGNGGYRFGALVVDAALFLPQSRPRLFMIAVRNDLPVAATGKEDSRSPWRPAALRTAHGLLPDPLRSKWIWFDPPTPPARTAQLLDMIEHHPTDVAWHDDAVTQRMLKMMSATNRTKVHTAQMRNRRIVGTVYNRTRIEGGSKVQRAEVRFDGKAGCLRTPGGGSSVQSILLVEDGRVRSRRLSARETARLMGLDDAYLLPKNYIDAYHLTGDGVAVPAVRFIADAVIEPILKGWEASVVAA